MWSFQLCPWCAQPRSQTGSVWDPEQRSPACAPCGRTPHPAVRRGGPSRSGLVSQKPTRDRAVRTVSAAGSSSNASWSLVSESGMPWSGQCTGAASHHSPILSKGGGVVPGSPPAVPHCCVLWCTSLLLVKVDGLPCSQSFSFRRSGVQPENLHSY